MVDAENLGRELHDVVQHARELHDLLREQVAAPLHKSLIGCGICDAKGNTSGG
jgi:hypothetical protein